MRYFEKSGGYKVESPLKMTRDDVLFALFGGIITLSMMAYFINGFDNLYILILFVSTAIFLFGFPHSTFSQPKNVIFGHLFSAYITLFFFDILGSDWLCLILAFTVAVCTMLVSNSMHPPAALNPFVIYMTGVNFDYMIQPLLVATITLVLVALFYNNLNKNVSYPQSWY